MTMRKHYTPDQLARMGVAQRARHLKRQAQEQAELEAAATAKMADARAAAARKAKPENPT